jgi:uncharacterized protein (TIGR03083 family)
LAELRQFYGGIGVLLRLDREVGAPAVAWQSHRARLRTWLDAVPDSDWCGPTRCALWDMTALVRHLVSGSQFLGYTLHKANRGISTEVMRGFDTQLTAQADAARFGEMTPGTARDLLAAKDASVAAEFVGAGQGGWSAMAEAPPGRLPAHMAVNHFLLDSWVHEYDLMLPRGAVPAMDHLEAELAVSYLIGLASLQAGSTTFLDLRLTSPDLRIGLSVADEMVHVTVGSAPAGAAVIESQAVDLVDRATGRQGGPVRGDKAALAVLDYSAGLLAR